MTQTLRPLTLLLSAALLGGLYGCDGSLPTSGPTKTKSKYPSNVTMLNVATTANATGDLSSGKTYDLAWAETSSVACFVGSQRVHFQGNHVLYAFTLPKQSNVTITVTPDAKTDVSLYAYQVPSTSTGAPLPPNVDKVNECEVSMAQDAGGDPGEAEQVKLSGGSGDDDVIVGVAGPKGVTSGAYTLKVELTK